MLCSVDVTDAVIDEALATGAQLVVAHHPLLLHGVHSVATDTPKGRLVCRLVRAEVALLTAHTNADTPAGGVADALASALGLRDLMPLRAGPGRPSD